MKSKDLATLLKGLEKAGFMPMDFRYVHFSNWPSKRSEGLAISRDIDDYPKIEELFIKTAQEGVHVNPIEADVGFVGPDGTYYHANLDLAGKRMHWKFYRGIVDKSRLNYEKMARIFSAEGWKVTSSAVSERGMFF